MSITAPLDLLTLGRYSLAKIVHKEVPLDEREKITMLMISIITTKIDKVDDANNSNDDEGYESDDDSNHL